MDYGLWTMDYGLWTMDYGLWTKDFVTASVEQAVGPWQALVVRVAGAEPRRRARRLVLHLGLPASPARAGAGTPAKEQSTAVGAGGNGRTAASCRPHSSGSL